MFYLNPSSSLSHQNLAPVSWSPVYKPPNLQEGYYIICWIWLILMEFCEILYTMWLRRQARRLNIRHKEEYNQKAWPRKQNLVRVGPCWAIFPLGHFRWKPTTHLGLCKLHKYNIYIISRFLELGLGSVCAVICWLAVRDCVFWIGSWLGLDVIPLASLKEVVLDISIYISIK